MPLALVLKAALELAEARQKELADHLTATKGSDGKPDEEEESWARPEMLRLQTVMNSIRDYLVNIG